MPLKTFARLVSPLALLNAHKLARLITIAAGAQHARTHITSAAATIGATYRAPVPRLRIDNG
jgi:hypothetical protein